MLNTATNPKKMHRADNLSDYELRGIGENIGKINGFYFDDKHWTIRYIVANTGNWLTGRQVLISPYSLGAVNNEEEFIAVNLTPKQIEDSPTYEIGQAVSQQFEDEYNTYYGLPTYWKGPNMWGAEPNMARDTNRIQGVNVGAAVGPNITGDTNTQRSAPGEQMRDRQLSDVNSYDIKASDGGIGAATNMVRDTNRIQGVNVGAAIAPNITGDTNMRRESAPGEQMRDYQLHNTSDVNGYDIEASDGEIGDVKDFIIDEDTWAIRYLIVDTGGWLPGKKVLIAPQWIERVSWEESKVFVNLSRDAIEKSPEFTEELTRDYEAGLYKHYNRQGYWIE